MHRDTPRRLRHASGYLLLGMLTETTAELEAIDPEDRQSTEVLTARAGLHLEAKNWDALLDVGSDLACRVSADEHGWSLWAFALRQLQRVEEAKDVLIAGEPLYAASATMHYKLACYHSLLGEVAEAKERLERACKMDPDFKKHAVDDPDLDAVWASWDPEALE